MATTTALPLSQQTLTWVLQAMGLLDDDHTAASPSVEPGTDGGQPRVSRSTARSALRGAPILRSWDRLLDHFFDVLGVRPGEEQRERVAAGLHEFDAKVSALDPKGLPLEDLLPPVLRLLAPHLGVRLGALAALADLSLVPDPTTGRTPPAIGDALCDPLSPRFFGAVVEFFLWRHHPEWRTLEQQTDELEAAGIAAKKTVERWRSGQVEVPNVVNLVALARILGDEPDQHRAMAALRCARLLVALRQDLAVWVGDALAEDAERVVAAWAHTTRATLVRPEAPAELAEIMAELLRSRHGEDVLAALRVRYPGVVFGEATPALIATRLREAAAAVRAGADPEPLHGLIVDQITAPFPIVMPFVGVQLAGPGYLLYLAADPFATIQGAWSLSAMLRRVAAGEVVHVQPPGTAEARPVRPDEALRQQAADLLARMRHLGRASEDGLRMETEDLQFLVALLNATGAPWDPQGLAGAWNEAARYFTAPAALEPFASDEAVRSSPHLAPVRAERLATEGKDNDALQLLLWWKDRPDPKSWEELQAAAATMIRVGHRTLDRVAPARKAGASMPRFDLALLSQESQANLDKIARALLTLLRQAQEVGEQLLAHAAHWLLEPPDARATMRKVTLLLPLVIRLDELAVDLAGGLGDRRRRATGLARELERGLQVLPSHGEAWATLAAWQELEGLQPLAVKQAKHFGAETTYLSLREMFERDGLLVQR